MADGSNFTVSFGHTVGGQVVPTAAAGSFAERDKSRSFAEHDGSHREPAGQGARRSFRTRRRGRHGRGMRSPLLPADLPGSLSRAALFDQYVADSAERLHQLWGTPIESVEFRVEEIPPGLEELAASREHIPLGDVDLPRTGAANSIVIYRHPVLTAAKGQGEIAELVHDVVVEQAAVLLGTTPEAVDPMYGRFGA